MANSKSIVEVSYSDDQELTVNDIQRGELFLNNKNLYIRTDDRGVPSSIAIIGIRLLDATALSFKGNEPVCRVHATITVRPL